MKDTIFLIFNSAGVKGFRKTMPLLRAGEYATQLNVSVDNKYFKRIIPLATLELDDKFLIEPKIILEAQEKVVEIPREEVTE